MAGGHTPSSKKPMNRSSRNLLTVTLFLLVGVLIIALITVSGFLEESRESDDVLTQVTSETEDLLSPDSDIQAAADPPEPSITGRVVDSRLRGVSGLEVVCGGDVAETDDTGRFEFPAEIRQGRRELSLRRQGEEIARWEVWLGTIDRESRAPDSDAILHQPSTEKPAVAWRPRWSVTLFDGERQVVARDGRDEGNEESPGAEALLSIRAVFVEEWGSTGVVHYHGTSGLPEGAQLSAAIFLEDRMSESWQRVVASVDPATVVAGEFRGEFPLPSDFQFYSARYDFRLYFDTLFGDHEQLGRWKSEHPEIPWQEIQDLQLVSEVYIGFESDETRDNERMEQYYVRTLSKAVALKKLLESQWLEAKRNARGWDMALLEHRVAARSSWLQRGFVSKTGEFLEAEWRHFLDDGWRPALRALVERHSQLAEEKYQRGRIAMERLLLNLIAISRNESILLYESFGLPKHRNDFYLDDYTVSIDAGMLQRMISGDIKLLTKYSNIGRFHAEKETESPDSDNTPSQTKRGFRGR